MNTLQRRLNFPDGRTFDKSLRLLREMGLAPWAIDYYTVLARATNCLPHELIVRTLQAAAWSQLDTLVNQPLNAAEWSKEKGLSRN